jgi:hypothetical protein
MLKTAGPCNRTALLLLLLAIAASGRTAARVRTAAVLLLSDATYIRAASFLLKFEKLSCAGPAGELTWLALLAPVAGLMPSAERKRRLPLAAAAAAAASTTGQWTVR